MANSPFKMAGFSGFGNSPLKQEKKTKEEKEIVTEPVPTAGDTLGAYLYQNYPEMEIHPEGGPKIKAAHEKLKGHKVTEEEMKKSAKSYLKTGK
tara:strand:+ start:307 stop:588 length:282 start_codon:yes stop_codon:yes gene_type:complete